MLKTKQKRTFFVGDMDTISTLALAELPEESTNRQMLVTLHRAAHYAAERELTARQHECYTLFYRRRLRVSDIATQLGVSCSTVSRHLRAARLRVQGHACYSVLAYRPTAEGYAPARRNS